MASKYNLLQIAFRCCRNSNLYEFAQDQESKNLDAGILDCRICQHRKTWGGGDEQRFDDGQVRPPVRQFSGTALLLGWAAMLQRNPKNEQKALVSNLI